MYVPPAVPLEQPDLVMGTASYTPYTQPINDPNPFKGNQALTPNSDQSDQLEFSFSPSKQDITNDLLKEISNKLTKVINLLEKQEGGDKLVPKLKPNVKQNQVQ
jgi:hypothetical protein